MRAALRRAPMATGTMIATNVPIMPITTRSSMSEKPRLHGIPDRAAGPPGDSGQ